MLKVIKIVHVLVEGLLNCSMHTRTRACQNAPVDKAIVSTVHIFNATYDLFTFCLTLPFTVYRSYGVCPKIITQHEINNLILFFVLSFFYVLFNGDPTFDTPTLNAPTFYPTTFVTSTFDMSDNLYPKKLC